MPRPARLGQAAVQVLHAQQGLHLGDEVVGRLACRQHHVRPGVEPGRGGHVVGRQPDDRDVVLARARSATAGTGPGPSPGPRGIDRDQTAWDRATSAGSIPLRPVGDDREPGRFQGGAGVGRGGVAGEQDARLAGPGASGSSGRRSATAF